MSRQQNVPDTVSAQGHGASHPVASLRTIGHQSDVFWNGRHCFAAVIQGVCQ